MVAQTKLSTADLPLVTCVARARAGDIAAFEELVRRYERPIFNFLLGLLRNPHDAEDVAQDVWVKVAAGLPRLREADRFGPWLYRTARNSYLDLTRARRRRPQMPLDDGDGAPELAEAAAIGPEQRLLSSDERRKVWEALGGLNERHRTALFLREFQSMSYDDIGQTLGISRGAAEVLLFRAREGFRKQFARVDSTKSVCTVNPLRLSALIDGELGSAARADLARHIDGCDPCASRLRAMRTGQKLYRGLGLVAAPEAARNFILAKIAALLGGSSIVAGTVSGPGFGGGAASVAIIGKIMPGLAAKIAVAALSLGAVTAVVEHPVPAPAPAEQPAAQMQQATQVRQALAPGPVASAAAAQARSTAPGQTQAAPAALREAEPRVVAAQPAADVSVGTPRAAQAQRERDEARGPVAAAAAAARDDDEGPPGQVRREDDGPRAASAKEKVEPDAQPDRPAAARESRGRDDTPGSDRRPGEQNDTRGSDRGSAVAAVPAGSKHAPDVAKASEHREDAGAKGQPAAISRSAGHSGSPDRPLTALQAHTRHDD